MVLYDQVQLLRRYAVSVKDQLRLKLLLYICATAAGALVRIKTGGAFIITLEILLVTGLPVAAVYFFVGSKHSEIWKPFVRAFVFFWLCYALVNSNGVGVC